MAPESGPLTQPNWRAYPSASATETSLKRSVDSLTILIRALALRLCCAVGCVVVSMCAWRSCAKAHNKLALRRASVVRQCLDAGANCLTLARNVGKRVLLI